MTNYYEGANNFTIVGGSFCPVDVIANPGTDALGDTAGIGASDDTAGIDTPGDDQCIPGPSPKARGSKSLRVDIAVSTLDRIEQGSYNIDGRSFDLTKGIQEMKSGTIFFQDSALSDWLAHPPTSGPDCMAVKVTVTQCSTLSGVHALNSGLNPNVGDKVISRRRIGVLNFASAKNPGGGFLTGAQAQEESIARSSTIYCSLMTDTAQRFYRSHRKNPQRGYYSHAMIYSPRVFFIRSDDGSWHEPIEVEVVTSCAVNAGVVRRYLRQANTSDEEDIDNAMKERMARVLYLFEKQEVRNLVLGSFGTGVFRNRVDLVARIWKELLVGENARFRFSFDRVEFSILDSPTCETFKEIF